MRTREAEGRDRTTDLDDRLELAPKIRHVEALLVDDMRFRMGLGVGAVPLKRVCEREKRSVTGERKKSSDEGRRTDRLLRSDALNDKTNRVGEAAGVVRGVSWVSRQPYECKRGAVNKDGT